MHVGLIGTGAIGQSLLTALDDDAHDVARLTILCRPASAQALRARLDGGGSLSRAAKIVTDAEALAGTAPDLVVECAGHSAVAAHVPTLLRAGIDVVLASVGSLADAGLEATLRDAANAGNARLILPAGAIGGIDVISALALSGKPMQLHYRGIKPPAAWAGSPADTRLDLAALTAPTAHFSGSARQAAAAYPKNANVAATLALAGPGLDDTTVELIADPEAGGNIHDYTVTTPDAQISMRIEGRPTEGNARSSATTMWSLLREISNRNRAVVT